MIHLIALASDEVAWIVPIPGWETIDGDLFGFEQGRPPE
jgi:hypothetical protein